MSIRDELGQIYSTRYNLRYTPLASPLNIEIQSEPCPEFRNKLNRGLSSMFLETSTSGILVNIGYDEERDRIFLRYRGKTLYFRRDCEPVKSMLWVLYCISARMDKIITGLDCCGVGVRAFSAPQLICEKKLVDCLEWHFDSRNGTPPEQLLEELSDCTRELERKAPVFSKQPVCKVGFERYHTPKHSFSLLKKKERRESVALGEFADRLFYNDSFDYISRELADVFIKKLEKYSTFALERYKGKLDEAEELLLRRLYKLPLASVQVTLLKLKNLVATNQSRQNLDNKREEILKEFSETIETFELEPGKIRRAFEAVDELYADIAQIIIRKDFLSKLLSDVSEKMDSQVNEAHEKLSNVRRTLGSIVNIPYSSDPLHLGWNELGNIPENLGDLPEETDPWNGESMNVLHSFCRGSAHPFRAWFCSDSLRHSLSGIQDEGLCYAVPLMNDQIVFGLYTWPEKVLRDDDDR